MTQQGLSHDQLTELRKYDTPTVCNAIELFDVRSRTAGYMDARLRSCFPKMPPMVGYASTATFRSAAAPPVGNAYAGLDEQIKAFESLPGPAVVVFQDLDNPVVAATFGEVMCTTYKTFGAVGLITSGAGRDLEQVEAMNFPCFTNGTICAHGYCHIPAVGLPVHVGGLMIESGELLHGDCNGVSTIPQEIASEVAGVCAEVVEAEAIVLDYLKSGSATPKGFAEARLACQEQIQSVARRLQNK